MEIEYINAKKLIRLASKNRIICFEADDTLQNRLKSMPELSGIETVYSIPSKTDKRALFFNRVFSGKPLENIVAFHSGQPEYVPGFDFSDNSRAMFEYMIENNYNNKYKLVWFVKYPNEYRAVKKIRNVEFVSYDWKNSNNPVRAYKYWYYLLNAKFFFITDASYWLKYCRKEQVRVNLWHGCGFKCRKNNKGLPLREFYEYMTVTSQLYANIHRMEFGLNKEQVLVTGLAKQDLLFHPPKKGLNELLNIKKTEKYIFWLPTFRVAAAGLEKLNEYQLRSEVGLPVILNEAKMNEADKYLQQLNVFLIIKLHPLQNNSSVSHGKYENIAIIDNADISKMDLQINTLLSKADALISDYSSAAVDYMLLDRPIAFTLDDVEEYKNSRGFVFENIHEWLPGKEIYTYDDFIGFIKEIADGADSTAEKRRTLLDKMHTYHDGNNCKRILEQFELYGGERKLMKVKVVKKKNLKKIAIKKRFICFGAGVFLHKKCSEIYEYIDYVADNCPGLWGTEIILAGKHIKVVCPSELDRIYTPNHILLVTTRYHMQIIEQIRAFTDINEVYYIPTKTDIAAGFFKKLYNSKPLKDIIVFRSGHSTYIPGVEYSDNARAVFEYMVKNNYTDKYRLVWFVKYPNEFKSVKKINNTDFVSYDWANSNNPIHRYKYWYYVLNAKIFFVTSTTAWLRYCRKEQLRVNLWHGCGFKDRKINKGVSSKRDFEYMTVTSPLYADIHEKYFGLEKEQLLITGLAKQDLLFNPPALGIDEFLGIKKAGKYVFWLPTFRIACDGMENFNEYNLSFETGLPIIESQEQMYLLDRRLNECDVFLVIKLHHAQNDSLIPRKQYQNIKIINGADIFKMDLQINTLLSKANALISDYSSVAVDYMLLDRPIAFTLDDVEEYRQSRGFVFKNIQKWLPGKEIYTYEDFNVFIEEVANGIDSTAEKRRTLLKKMHTYQDGNSCKRILEHLNI